VQGTPKALMGVRFPPGAHFSLRSGGSVWGVPSFLIATLALSSGRFPEDDL
jgi:hypothetical protein